jgi:D-tyrosyl-tRNA(Tyr) deacylase
MLLCAGGLVVAGYPLVRFINVGLARGPGLLGSGHAGLPVIGVIQRVSRASVAVSEEVVARIGTGLLVLVGVTHSDTVEDARSMGSKIADLRVFRDDKGLMNKSVGEMGGQVLVVSQFTLLGDTRKGRRPSFVGAASPDVAAPLINELEVALGQRGIPVKSGVFGADMRVELVNDGPVTLILRTEAGRII